jgi:hypothetical protein
MTLTILEVNLKKPKLKVTPKEAELKIPVGTTKEEVKRLSNFSSYVIQSLPDIQTVLTGRFRFLNNTWCIKLHNDSKSYYSEFFKEP